MSTYLPKKMTSPCWLERLNRLGSPASPRVKLVGSCYALALCNPCQTCSWFVTSAQVRHACTGFRAGWFALQPFSPYRLGHFLVAGPLGISLIPLKSILLLNRGMVRNDTVTRPCLFHVVTEHVRRHHESKSIDIPPEKMVVPSFFQFNERKESAPWKDKARIWHNTTMLRRTRCLAHDRANVAEVRETRRPNMISRHCIRRSRDIESSSKHASLWLTLMTASSNACMIMITG